MAEAKENRSYNYTFNIDKNDPKNMFKLNVKDMKTSKMYSSIFSNTELKNIITKFGLGTAKPDDLVGHITACMKQNNSNDKVVYQEISQNNKSTLKIAFETVDGLFCAKFHLVLPEHVPTKMEKLEETVLEMQQEIQDLTLTVKKLVNRIESLEQQN